MQSSKNSRSYFICMLHNLALFPPIVHYRQIVPKIMIICKVTIASIVDKHINSVGNLMSYLFIKLKSTTTPATGQAAIIKTDILAK